MEISQKNVISELKKIIEEDLPNSLNKEQMLKLKQIEKELCEDEYKC